MKNQNPQEEKNELSENINFRISEKTKNELDKLVGFFGKDKSTFLRIIVKNVIKDPIYYEMMVCGGIGYLLERLDPVEFERELPHFVYGKLREKKSDEKIHFWQSQGRV